jgi:Papain family cysteine protease
MTSALILIRAAERWHSICFVGLQAPAPKRNSRCGGFHNRVLEYVRTQGVSSDSGYPYTGSPGNCSGNHAFRAVNWDFVDPKGGQASLVAIKQAICTHGPVVSAVFVTPKFRDYIGGIFNEFAEGKGSSEINHDVVIVGWDDPTQAWEIKNSWSQNWGEEGFMQIRYRSNYIGSGAARVDAARLKTPVGVEEQPGALDELNLQLNQIK